MATSSTRDRIDRIMREWNEQLNERERQEIAREQAEIYQRMRNVRYGIDIPIQPPSTGALTSSNLDEAIRQLANTLPDEGQPILTGTATTDVSEGDMVETEERIGDDGITYYYSANGNRGEFDEEQEDDMKIPTPKIKYRIRTQDGRRVYYATSIDKEEGTFTYIPTERLLRRGAELEFVIKDLDDNYIVDHVVPTDTFKEPMSIPTFYVFENDMIGYSARAINRIVAIVRKEDGTFTTDPENKQHDVFCRRNSIIKPAIKDQYILLPDQERSAEGQWRLSPDAVTSANSWVYSSSSGTTT